jgi:hypothetical protein
MVSLGLAAFGGADGSIRTSVLAFGILALCTFIYSFHRTSRLTRLVAETLWRRLGPEARAAAIARAKTGTLQEFVNRYPHWKTPGFLEALKEVARASE